MNKILQPYKDWLMLTRGKIEPKVGDKIINIFVEEYIDEEDIEEFNRVHDKDDFFENWLNSAHVEVPYPIVDLTGLKKDGYTFICPIHGLHPNCNCQDNQIKVFNENHLDNILNIILNEANEIKQKHDDNSLCKYQGEYFIRFEWLKDMIELQKNQLKLLKE